MLHRGIFVNINLRSKLHELVKSHEFKNRWLSKKVYIQGVVFFRNEAIHM
jgi:hypothetical protein